MRVRATLVDGAACGGGQPAVMAESPRVVHAQVLLPALALAVVAVGVLRVHSTVCPVGAVHHAQVTEPPAAAYSLLRLAGTVALLRCQSSRFDMPELTMRTLAGRCARQQAGRAGARSRARARERREGHLSTHMMHTCFSE